MKQENETTREPDLRDQLRRARERVDSLIENLRSVDNEIAGFDAERRQYAKLQEICQGFDELEELGGSQLFWDSKDAGGKGEDQLRNVRSRIADFEKQLAEMDARRQAILDKIQFQEDAADYLAGDVLAAEEEEEQKKLEWLIEREVESIPIRPSIMPWFRGGEDDARFRKSLAISLLVSLLIAFALPLVDIPIPERWEVLDETERLTQLIREERPLPPVAQIDIPIPEAAEEPTPVEEEDSAAADELVPESAPAAKPAEKPSAGNKGLLAFRKKFSGLATNQNVDRLGSNARISDPGDLAQGVPQRSMVTSDVPGSSGGINVAALSRGTGGSGQAMSGVAVTQATSSIGSGTGNGTGRPTSGGGGPGLGRTDEEIQIVFDRHKAALYRLYNRELRKNPTLKGQMVLRMTIEPDGSVSMCEVKSSDLKSPALSKSVASRVRGFDFGAKEGIPAVTIVYPIDFLPAT